MQVHRGSRAREPKFLFLRSVSTAGDKIKRHRNKKRIWRRAVRRLESALIYDTARTLEVRAESLPA